MSLENEQCSSWQDSTLWTFRMNVVVNTEKNKTHKQHSSITAAVLKYCFLLNNPVPKVCPQMSTIFLNYFTHLTRISLKKENKKTKKLLWQYYDSKSKSQ